MTPLPDWSIQALAEGHGIEARLAQMVLALQEELEQQREIAMLGGKTNRRLMELVEELRKQLDRQKVTPGWGEIALRPTKYWLGKP